MDAFSKKSPAERQIFFEEAATRMGVHPQIVEKDFWVCWTLRRLFTLSDLKGHLTFKGGTSLSKGYSLIRRFSEDIDVSVNREFLGFVGDKDPEQPDISGNARKRLLEELNATCAQKIAALIHPALSASISSHLSNAENWSLTIAEEDEQTLLFIFPSCWQVAALPYVKQVVKIEMGARSDHWPCEEILIAPYVSEYLSGFGNPNCAVHTLRPERNFPREGDTIARSSSPPHGEASTERAIATLLRCGSTHPSGHRKESMLGYLPACTSG